MFHPDEKVRLKYGSSPDLRVVSVDEYVVTVEYPVADEEGGGVELLTFHESNLKHKKV
jgi:hypothetical protein